MAKFNVYDVLHHPEKLTAYYLLDEIESMLGQSVTSVVRHNKQIEYESELDANQF